MGVGGGECRGWDHRDGVCQLGLQGPTGGSRGLMNILLMTGFKRLCRAALRWPADKFGFLGTPVPPAAKGAVEGEVCNWAGLELQPWQPEHDWHGGSMNFSAGGQQPRPSLAVSFSTECLTLRHCQAWMPCVPSHRHARWPHSSRTPTAAQGTSCPSACAGTPLRYVHPCSHAEFGASYCGSGACCDAALCQKLHQPRKETM